MRILLTGAAGFIGSHTADRLLDHGHMVLAVDNFTSGRSENLKSFMERGGIMNIADVTDYQQMSGIFSNFKPATVIHLAAQPAISFSINNPVLDVRVNTIGTINMVMLAKKYGVMRFVFSSTSAVYDENLKGTLYEKSATSPRSPYGISKMAAEHYIRYFFPNHVIFRYGNIYGPRQQPLGENQVVARAFKHFLSGSDFKVVGSGKQKRDFTYVGDIARLNSCNDTVMGGVCGTFNASTGKSISVMDVLGVMEEMYGVPGYPWEHTDKEDPRGDVKMDAKLVDRYLFWKAETSIKDGIMETARWWHEVTKRNDFSEVVE